MFYSRAYYTGDGVITNYAVPFNYINKSHIHAAVKESGATSYTEVAFSFLSSGQIALSSAPAANASILIYRETPRDTKLVNYSDESLLTMADMNLDSLQHFYIVQEMTDLSGVTSTESNAAAEMAATASEAAQAAATDAAHAAELVDSFTDTIEAASQAVTNAAENAQQAVTTANEAANAATTAAGQVAQASQDASNALSSANAAATTAGTAASTATTALTTANTALTTANTALTTANAAASTAGAAATSAAAAQTAAQEAAADAAELALAVSESSHGHANKDTLDKISESAGAMTFDGDALVTDAELQAHINAESAHSIETIPGLEDVLDEKAPRLSPIFTGTPTAPTADTGTNTTQVATTEFVQSTIAAASRILLKAPLTINVSASGNDSNDGLTTGTALATMQAAWNLLANQYDLGGQEVTIHLVDGNYTDCLVASGKICGQTGSVIVSGNTTTPANVAISHSTAATFLVTNGASVELRGMTISNSSSYSGVQVENATAFIGSGVVFNTCSGVNGGQLFASTNGMIYIKNSYSILGGGVRHFLVSTTGTISVPSGYTPTVTVASGVAYSGQFAYVKTGGILETGAIGYIYTTVTGARYYVNGNGVIWTGGAGENFLPGNAAGTKLNGGIYV